MSDANGSAAAAPDTLVVLNVDVTCEATGTVPPEILLVSWLVHGAPTATSSEVGRQSQAGPCGGGWGGGPPRSWRLEMQPAVQLEAGGGWSRHRLPRLQGRCGPPEAVTAGGRPQPLPASHVRVCCLAMAVARLCAAVSACCGSGLPGVGNRHAFAHSWRPQLGMEAISARQLGAAFRIHLRAGTAHHTHTHTPTTLTRCPPAAPSPRLQPTDEQLVHVKPLYSTSLSAYCTQVTGVTTEEAMAGKPLKEAIEQVGALGPAAVGRPRYAHC